VVEVKASSVARGRHDDPEDDEGALVREAQRVSDDTNYLLRFSVPI